MADIELVIKIPEEMYAQIINEDGIDTMLIPYKDIIKNGKPLPKGHGNLIDADKLLVHKMYGIFGKAGYKTEAVYVDDINDAPTII